MNAALTNRVVLVLCLALSSTASAAEVTETAVIHHGQAIPRFTKQYIHVLEVPPGETVKLPPSADYDAIEVAGTLDASKCERLRMIHLLILPGGKVVPPPATCDWSIKDVPIDHAIDPDEWGNGIINFGDFLPAGRPKTPYAYAMSVEAGSSILELVTVPADWEEGDELILPDTRQIGKKQPIRREAPVFIAAIDGGKITLSKPLDFEHHDVRDPEGNLVARLPVFNLTRSFVIRSENPSGTRGHIVHLEDARAIADAIKLVDLGRTTIKPLGPDNQVGRYAWHWHHNVPGVHTGSGHEGGGPIDDPSDPAHPTVGSLTGSVLVSTVDGPKWGAVIHATHFTHVAKNIAIGFTGSCFITEDGDEIGNVIEDNAALYSKGNELDGKFSFLREMPGGEGAGFWGHSTGLNVWRNNMAYNCAIGFAPFYREQVRTRKVPSKPGGPLDQAYDPRKALPIEFRGNVAVSNRVAGIEYWNQPKFPVVDQVCAHNGKFQIKAGSGAPGHLVLEGLHAIASGGKTIGISTSRAYTSSLTLENSVIEGCEIGLQQLRHGYTVRNTRLKNTIDFAMTQSVDDELIRARIITLDSVVCEGDEFLRFNPDLSRAITHPYYDNQGYRILLKNWQQSGKDYTLHRANFTRDRLALTATASRLGVYAPEANITFGELWDKYGLGGPDGGPVPVDAVPLEGTNGFARELVGEFPLGPPRFIVCFPNMSSSFTERDFWVQFTGQSVEGGDFDILIDGVRPTFRRGDLPNRITHVASPTLRQPGAHTIKTWRTTAAGERIPESEMSFQYFVGAPSESTQNPEHEATRGPEPKSQRDPRVGLKAAGTR